MRAVAIDDGDDLVDDELWEYCWIDLYGKGGGLHIRSEDGAERRSILVPHGTIRTVERAAGSYFALFGLKLTLEDRERSLLLIPTGEGEMQQLLQAFERHWGLTLSR